MIPYGCQDISESDIEAVLDVLRSKFLTQGPAVPVFEKTIASFCGAEHAVAVNSATSALHIACLALGVGPDDWVWTSPISFVASANCALYCGARIDFVDIDSLTYNMSVARLTEKLVEAEQQGCLPKVVIPVHHSGQSCEMEGIHALSKRYNFRIIEDASHAIGGTYKGVDIGNCRYSDATVFSFHPVKIITTAEGGMVLVNDSDLAEQMQRLRSHGITRRAEDMSSNMDGPWYYEQLDLGFNYRLTDLQAALGTNQFQRLDEFVTLRGSVARRYNEAFKSLPLSIPWEHPDSCSAKHLYVIRLNLTEIDKTHLQVFESLRSAEIGVNLHYIPIYRQPYYKQFGFYPESYPEAERYYAEAISLPMFPRLTVEQQNRVILALEAAIEL
jgi:UDP-4-amino-4,6-dideoxy-N-acetyl-beta-L-altrosamine transaminase